MKRMALGSLLLLALMLPVTSHAYVVNYDNGTLYQTKALTGFSTWGDMMDGMSVTAYFTAGGSESKSWADTGAGSGGVSGTDWSLTESGDTFGSNWNLIARGITRLVIDGVPGDTIFDTRRFGDVEGTPGSARGWTFETAYTGSLEATYRNWVKLTGFAPAGDLYTMLDLNFGPNGFAGDMSFIADTDNAATAGDIKPAPEPATLLLLGLGLVGLTGIRRK